MGRTEGRDHGRGTETHHREHAPGASRPTTASTTSSPRPTGCRGPTTSGWGNRCSATPSPGTSTPTPAYAQFRQTTVPENVSVGPVTGAAGPFNYLPWEVSTRAGRAVRHAARDRLAVPTRRGQGGALRLGRGGPLGRGHQTATASTGCSGQAGVRASLPMWSVDPTFSSDLFNVHGIAHKVVFDAEFSYAQANQNLEDLPLYDPLDDDSVEAFRRRFLTTTFGIPSMSPCRRLPPGTPWVPQVRRAALRPADRPARLGHLAEHGNRRRPDGPPPGGGAAVADQARPARRPPHHRLDHAGHEHHVLSRPQPRQLRHSGWGCWTTTSAGTWATG